MEARTKMSGTCGKNVGGCGSFVACGKPAVRWYKHNDDVCAWCADHDYVCGDPMPPPAAGEDR